MELRFFVIIGKILSIYFAKVEFDRRSFNFVPKSSFSRFSCTEYINMKSLKIQLIKCTYLSV